MNAPGKKRIAIIVAIDTGFSARAERDEPVALATVNALYARVHAAVVGHGGRVLDFRPDHITWFASKQIGSYETLHRSPPSPTSFDMAKVRPVAPHVVARSGGETDEFGKFG